MFLLGFERQHTGGMPAHQLCQATHAFNELHSARALLDKRTRPESTDNCLQPWTPGLAE